MGYDWDTYADEHGQFYEMTVPPTLERYLTLGSSHVFMDVGCGDGSLLYSLERRQLLKGKDVIAVDISEKRVQAVQRINKAFRCHVDDACKLDNIEDDSVDVIASLQVIEHVPDDEKMVSHLHRVLSDGGVAYITTIFKTGKARYFYRNATGESVIDPTHVREYKDDRLIDLLRSANFEIVESRKYRILKPILGFKILWRVNRDRDLLVKHPLLATLRKLKVPVPGYYHWEIVVRKRRGG